MRLGYVGRTTAHPYCLKVLDYNKQDPDTALHLVRTWAWNPWLMEQNERLGHYLHNRTSIDKRLKQLAIVRVCTINYSAYELYHQVPGAIRAGLTADEIEAIQSLAWEDSNRLTDEERACIRYADEFDSGRGVQETTFQQLRSYLNEQQIVEVSLQLGFWGANARLMKAVNAENEPWLAERHEQTLREIAPRNIPMEPRQPQHVSAARPPGSRIGLVEPDQATVKNQLWYSRWQEQYGPIPNLVKAWAWSEPLQVAQQLVWDVFAGDNIKLSRRTIAIAVRRVLWLNHTPYLMHLLESQGITRDLTSADIVALDGDYRDSSSLSPIEKSVVQFIDAWDTGLGISDDVFDAVYQHHDRQEMSELQWAAGYFGWQARFAKALELAPD
jgi:alkylhydroperoxidase family enzyme